ncbi:MAG: hypothetical protein ABI171_04365 [Collimonas sp.]
MQAGMPYYAIASHVPSGHHPLSFKTRQALPSINADAGRSA